MTDTLRAAAENLLAAIRRTEFCDIMATRAIDKSDKDCGFDDNQILDGSGEGYPGGPITEGDVRRLEKALAAEPGQADVLDERERCAKIAETLKTLTASLPVGPNGEFVNEHATYHGELIAAAIRKGDRRAAGNCRTP